VLAHCLALTVQQSVFGHHAFALHVSFDALGQALGLKPDLVHMRAHEQLGGQNVTISWRRAPGGAAAPFEFKGVITETSIETSHDLTQYYHIGGHSHTFLLDSGVQRRTFVKKSLADIFQQVLAPYPANDLPRAVNPVRQTPLPYVAQYGESNYQFLQRLAAQYGEWLFFDGNTLHFGRCPRPAPVRFQTTGLQKFTLSVQFRPVKARGAGYNYRTHEPLAAAATNPAGSHRFNQFALDQSAALFPVPNRYQSAVHVADGAQLKHALDQLATTTAAGLVQLQGESELVGLAPGAVLDVYDATGAGYGQFRVLSVHHAVNRAGDYDNSFTALPEAGQLPPANPAVEVPGGQPELADVIDLDDPKGLGRIRVRYHWDVRDPLDAESGWLRVSTPYSGDGKGQLFTPEVHSQVLVGYEHGLAEFPVVLGNLFHARNKQGAKYSAAGNHLKGLQTAGGNKVVMSDKKGEQTILLSNSNNKGTGVKVSFAGDGSVHIHSNGPVTVNGRVITLDAGAEGEIKLHAKTITLDAEDDVVVSAKNQGIALSAKEKMALTAKELMATGSDKATVQSSKELALNGGSKATLLSGKTKVH
jgi:Rhs element Vgr protein